MAASSPGVVFVKHWSDSSEEEIMLTKETCSQFEPTELPTTINPPGLSLEWYLYESIRPFCTEEDKDIVCPLPLAPNHAAEEGLQFQPVKMTVKIKGHHRSDFEGFMFEAFVIK